MQDTERAKLEAMMAEKRKIELMLARVGILLC